VRFFCLLLLGALATTTHAALIERTPISGSEVVHVRIEQPQRYWRETGFKLMSPVVRVSVAAHTGARTLIYLRLGTGANIVTTTNTDAMPSIKYPGGSESDRVSMVRYQRGGDSYTIDDVRGTRWDANGREYFHVYRASGPQPHAPLEGYEWPRDNPLSARAASDLLSKVVQNNLLPNGYRSSRSDVRRFTRLNRCESCHWADKAPASTMSDRGPPWATDGSGLYTPLGVLLDQAPLSAESSFHDPNTNDPYLVPRCGTAEAELQGSPGGYYFSCNGSDYPIGVRDVSAGIRANDPYSHAICDARRYLYSHLDTLGQRYFKQAMDACAG